MASAQPAGQLTGVVRDTTGSVLPGVTVTVTGAALIAPRTVVTDEHGEYVVDALPAGRYLVTAAFSGFEPSSTEIDVGATSATLDVVLAVSSLAERVTVTATRTGAADVQSTPVAITVLPATDARADGSADGRRPRGRCADGHDLAAHRAGAGDHPRHRDEQHVRRSKFHGSSRRRLSRTPRDGVCRFSERRTRRSPARAHRGRSTDATRSAARSTSSPGSRPTRSRRAFGSPPATTTSFAPKAPSAAR